MLCDCGTCEYCEDVDSVYGQMELKGEYEQETERRAMYVEEIGTAIQTLEKLQSDTQGVSVESALESMAWFLRHELSVVIELLKQAQVEREAA